MITEPLTGARKPEQTDGPLGGLQIANVVDDLAPNTVPSFANATARNTAYSNWVSAGGVMRKGLKSHTQNDDRYWRYDGSGWQYAGGAPPPIVACTVFGGWSVSGSQAPGVFKDASGSVHVVGMVSNNTSYIGNDAGLHQLITLPTGYRPAATFNIGIYVGGVQTVTGEVRSDGEIRVTNSANATIPVGAAHILNNITFHPGYTGTVPLS